MERAVDPTTGTLGVELLFPNRSRSSVPASTGGCESCSTPRQGALIPQRAVQELQNLYSVAIVEGDKVAFRNVKVGQRVDSLWVIEEGLKQENRSSSKAFSAFRTA